MLFHFILFNVWKRLENTVHVPRLLLLFSGQTEPAWSVIPGHTVAFNYLGILYVAAQLIENRNLDKTKNKTKTSSTRKSGLL